MVRITLTMQVILSPTGKDCKPVPQPFPTPVGHSIGLAKPAKPRSDFPLFPLANGRWAKKVWQRPIYFA